MNFALVALLVLSASPDPTKGWEKKKLTALGKEKFSFDATIKVPSKTKTTSDATTDSAGKRLGTMAYLDLPDGVRVILMERSAASITTEKSSLDMMESMIAMNGKIIVSRRDPTLYVFMAQTDQGVVFQASSWSVKPGLDCASMKPVTREQADQIVTICQSLAK